MLRAFRYKNFRLFFVGQSISLIGTWMQTVAMGWLVYRLTHSAFMLGVVGFASQVPIFLAAPFAGVIIDTWERKKIILWTQALALIQAFVAAALVLTGMMRVGHVLALGVALGLISALDMPARQAFMVNLVEKKEDLGNAIALNSFLFNAARLIGPSFAGLLIAAWGEGICFLVNGISYIAVLIALMYVRVAVRNTHEVPHHVVRELREGIAYTFGFMPIRAILFLLGVVSFMGMSYAVLMPIFAKEILKGGPQTLGFLMAASGLGALAGAVYLAARKKMLRPGRLIPVACIVFGLGLIGFALSQVLIVSLGFLFVAGFGAMVQMTACNTVIQTIVEDDKRGRVMSFYTMSFIGMSTFGALFAGTLASKIGAPLAMIIGGTCCIISALVFARNIRELKEQVRPIYEKMFALREVTPGV